MVHFPALYVTNSIVLGQITTSLLDRSLGLIDLCWGNHALLWPNYSQWVDFRENLQATIDFRMKNGIFV